MTCRMYLMLYLMLYIMYNTYYDLHYTYCCIIYFLSLVKACSIACKSINLIIMSFWRPSEAHSSACHGCQRKRTANVPVYER